MAKKCDQSLFVVYKVTDWRKYWFNDPDAELVKDGLTAWDARLLIRRLNKVNNCSHLSLYKGPVLRSDWDKDRAKFARIDLFDVDALKEV